MVIKIIAGFWTTTEARKEWFPWVTESKQLSTQFYFQYCRFQVIFKQAIIEKVYCQKNLTKANFHLYPSGQRKIIPDVRFEMEKRMAR